MAQDSIRYGVTIRKRVKAIKDKKRDSYKCGACGKTTVKRVSTSIWRCRHCNATYAGGAFTLTTQEGEVARRLIEGIAKR
jgi:large subunit ribosomal protein L37Ae